MEKNASSHLEITFSKMHGLGNDFMVIDATQKPFTLSKNQIARLGNRHTGVGFDQLLVVLPANAIHAKKTANDAKEVDFCYQIYNQDGSFVGNCGNGVRCFALYVLKKGLTNKTDLTIQTFSTQMTLKIDLTALDLEHHEQINQADVEVNMGKPDFNLKNLPCLIKQENSNNHYELLGMPYSFGVVSMGNPHAVIFIDQTTDLDQLNIEEIASCLQKASIFPESVNVGFAQIQARNHIKLRVYERGSGETLACGTGACAAAAIGIQKGWLDTCVNVDLKGGSLSIHWQNEEHLYMKGAAHFVFEGKIKL